jgi:hypothetical protein
MGFAGTKFALRVDKGTQDTTERLAYLLRHPNENVRATELAYKSLGGPKIKADPDLTVKEELESVKMREYRFADFSFKDLKKSQKLLKENILTEKSLGNFEEADILKGKYNEMSNYLIRTYDSSGNERGPRSENSKSLETIRKSINRFKEKIEKFSPELKKHLDKSIQYDKGTVTYRPPEEIIWDIYY